MTINYITKLQFNFEVLIFYILGLYSLRMSCLHPKLYFILSFSF